MLANGWINRIWVSGYGEADCWILDLGRLVLKKIVMLGRLGCNPLDLGNELWL